MKARLVVPELVKKKHVNIVKKIMDLNVDGQIMPINIEVYDDKEGDIVIGGSGYTVGYVPKEWMHIERE